jgi:hypothetical protein
MYLLLPWFALIAAIGLAWMMEQARAAGVPARAVAASAVLVCLGIAGLNLYQAYPLSHRRSTRYQDFEALFNGIAQRADKSPSRPEPRFAVVTPTGWKETRPVGYRIQDVYGVPRSPVTFLELESGRLPEKARTILADRETLVVFRPETDRPAQETAEGLLRELGKIPCPVANARGERRFDLWQSPELPRLCEPSGRAFP